MDSEKIGKIILELRKSEGLTQAQLAEKLMVSDKAVSKWELGASIPDIQQLESITQLFNISYDLLLSGDLERVKLMTTKGQEVKAVEKKKLTTKEWYKLDSAALVYPPQAKRDWNLVYRVSAVLKEEIDMENLTNALHDMVERFPTFMVCLKKGFFWYYLERMEKYPVVEQSDRHPNRPIKLDGKHYLFRVIADNQRISVEVFHSVSDAFGSTIFLISLLTRYYELKYGQVGDYKDALNALDIVNQDEIMDAYELYATNSSFSSQESFKQAYHIKEKRIKDNIVTHLVVNAQELKKIAKKYDCTVTELLTALYTKAFLKRKFYDRDRNPYVVQIPINLRSVFPSNTLRNFSLFTNVRIDEVELSLEELIDTIKKQIEAGRDKDTLKSDINKIVSLKNNVAIRTMPRGVKDFAIKTISKLIGNVGCTTVFSNLGVINAPDELKSIVDRLEFVMKDDIMGGVSMSAVTFNNKCDITFIRSIVKSTVERDMARELTDLGLEVYVEGNGGVRS